MSRFVCIDVETANPSLSSICQIGIVQFEAGGVASRWDTLVDPEDEFDEVNVSIHGISEDTVRDAPKLPQVYGVLRAHLNEQVVVCHTGFDRASVSQALHRYGLPPMTCRWLDSAGMVRRAWPEFARAGYGLANVCRKLEISFEHHNAVEDARAAGEVLLRAMQASGLDLAGCLRRVAQPITPGAGEPIRREGNADGPLSGNEIVFTGALSMTRAEAADVAARVGCDVAASVRKSTTLLVVGDQDVRRLNGHEKSSKHRKAQALIAAGQPIRILCETDFLAMIDEQAPA